MHANPVSYQKRGFVGTISDTEEKSIIERKQIAQNGKNREFETDSNFTFFFSLDSAWLLSCTALVWLMIPGVG